MCKGNRRPCHFLALEKYLFTYRKQLKKCCVFKSTPMRATLRWQRNAVVQSLLGDQFAEHCHTCVSFFGWRLVMGAKSLNVVLPFENSSKTLTQSHGWWKSGQSRKWTWLLVQNNSGFLLWIVNAPKRNFKSFVAKNDSVGQPPHAK